MARRKRKSSFLDNNLLPAILLSLGLHIAFLSTLHSYKIESRKALPTLEIMLEQPKKPTPIPLPSEPPKPEPSKPEPPKPLPKKAAPAHVAQALPAPAKPTPPKENPNPAVATATAQPAPEVIAATPAKDGESAFVAPTAGSDVEKPKDTSQQDHEADLSNYGSLLARELAKYKQYPRIAQIRGWQGTVHIKLEVDANGGVISSVVSQSSGFEYLDNQALEMVKKAIPLPQPPEGLRHKSITVTVPVLFRLN
jgi:protein TonB